MAYGREVPLAQIDNRVGMLLEDAPAAEAPLFLMENGVRPEITGPPDAVGWKTGDRILRINNTEITRFEHIFIAAILGKDEQALVEIERPLPEGGFARYLSPVTPRIIDEKLKSAQFHMPIFTGIVSPI